MSRFALVAVLLVSGASVLHAGEASFEGKPLREWVSLLAAADESARERASGALTRFLESERVPGGLFKPGNGVVLLREVRAASPAARRSLTEWFATTLPRWQGEHRQLGAVMPARAVRETARLLAAVGEPLTVPLADILWWADPDFQAMVDVATESLVALGPPAIAQMRESLQTAASEDASGELNEAAARAALVLARIEKPSDDLVTQAIQILRRVAESGRGVPSRSLGPLFRALGPAATAPLVRLLEERDEPLRLTALGALAALGRGAEGAREALARIAADAQASPPVREEAVITLGKLGPAGVEPLVAIIHPREDVGFRAVMVLAQDVGRPALPAVRRAAADPARREAAIGVLSLLGAIAYGELELAVAAARDPGEGIRAGALEAVGQICSQAGRLPKDAAGVLVAGLSDPNPDVRTLAVQALAELETAPPEVGVALVQGLTKESDERAQRLRALALCRLAPERVSPEVAAILLSITRGNLPLRHCDVHRIPPASQAFLLRGLLEDLMSSERERRAGAVDLIGEFGPAAREAMPLLQRISTDEEPWMAHRVYAALRRVDPSGVQAAITDLRKASSEPPPARPPPTLRPAPPLPDPFDAPAWTLAEMGPSAEAAVPTLVEALSSPWAQRRVRAAVALGGIGKNPALAVPALIAHLNDDDADVRSAALGALESFGTSAAAATPALLRAADDEDEGNRAWAVSALAAVCPDLKVVVPALVRAMDDEAALVRREAAKALGELGAKASAAVSALEARRDDEDVAMQRAVAVALIRIRGA